MNRTLELIDDTVCKGYILSFARRINQYQITVVHEDTGLKAEQWLPPDHIEEDTIAGVVRFCINHLEHKKTKRNEKEHNSV